MNGDQYEEEICPTCGLGMATECRGHEKPKADRQVRAGEVMYRAGYIAKMERRIKAAHTALTAIINTPHFYDMPSHVQELVKKALP